MTMPEPQDIDALPLDAGSSNLDELSPEDRAFVRRNLADLLLSLLIYERPNP